jgi:outer membrane protein TolC
MNGAVLRLSCVLAFVFISTMWPASSIAENDTGWTLERCLEEALDTSRTLRARADHLARAEAAAGEARAARLPTLHLEGSYTYTSEIMSLNLPPLGGFQIPEISFGDGNVYDMRVALKAPLFTGGALRARARAEDAARRATWHESRADSLNVIHGVRTAYFAALGAETRADVARVAERRLGRHVHDLDAALEIGTASEEARVQGLARLRQAEARTSALEAQARASRIALGNVVGRPGEEVIPRGDLDKTLRGERRQWGGVDTRPELFVLDERARQSRQLAGAAKGAYLPTVSAQLSYHYAKPGVDQIVNEWMDFASVGVIFSWPLWEWGARAKRVESARAAGRALEHERVRLLDALHTGLAVAEVNLESAREQLEKAAERVRLERRRLQLVENRYLRAAASENERLDAEDDLTAAEMDLAAATVQVRLAEAEILYVLGR